MSSGVRAMRRAIILVAAVSGFTASANAADFGAYGTFGTVGLGGGIAGNFGSHFGARVGYTAYDYEVEDLEESDVRLDGTAELGGVQALLDWYPFGGGFRFSIGAIESAELSARAEPVAGTYTFGGMTYAASDIGQATGTAKYDSFAPYLGLGFGRALSRDGRFAIAADLGVAFTGSAKVDLNATCNVSNPALCAQIDSAIAVEESELQAEADKFDYWPVLSLGISYRF
jgi:hypothetical protein